jgi:hypothetical protein
VGALPGRAARAPDAPAVGKELAALNPARAQMEGGTMGPKPLLTRMAVVLAALVPWSRVDAVPAFARLYGVSCSMCHDPIPRLSAFGQMFVGNGYRFYPGQPMPDRLATGDPLLQLPGRLRLAMRLDAYAMAYAGGNVVTDFQTPYNLKIISGGPLSEHLSYYIYFMLSEAGETGSIEDAYVTWNELAGAPVSVSVGQFQVSDVIFARELRLEREDYLVYRARVGSAPVNLTYDRGVMASADLAGFTFTGEIVNGNGNGAATASGRLDDDRHKSLMGYVSRELFGGLTLGVMGYATRQDGAAPGGPAVQDRIRMVGVNASVGLGPVEMRGQFLHREDASPTFTPGEATTITNGGFGEVLLHPAGTRWYAIALYNRVRASRPLLDFGLGGPSGVSRYETVTGGGGYLVRRNLRAYGEGTWDLALRATRWTLGMTLAF